MRRLIPATALPLLLRHAAAVADEAVSAEAVQPTTCTAEDQTYNEEIRAGDADEAILEAYGPRRPNGTTGC